MRFAHGRATVTRDPSGPAQRAGEHTVTRPGFSNEAVAGIRFELTERLRRRYEYSVRLVRSILAGNNPFGANQFDKTPVHGDVKKLAQAQRSAPLSGAPVSALNAPRRNQRHATGQDRPEGSGRRGGAVQALREAPVPSVSEVDPRLAQAETLAAQWEAAAKLPGASPLVKQYAREAREAVGRGA